MKEGIVQVYTGNGKGKTTAALGLALRACGHGYKVYMIQFLKSGWNYGEVKIVKTIHNFTIIQFGRTQFVDWKKPEKEDIELARQGLRHAEKTVRDGEYDMVILDEVNVALAWKLIDLERILKLIRNKPKHLELILTGRYAPEEVIEASDLVTEMKEIKHPFTEGSKNRAGIDY